jgi:Tfp pilus assembly protein PilZ
MGYTLPVIVFSEKVDKEAFDRVKKIPKVVIIEKPFESRDVWGICEKILQGKPVYQRVFRRFPTAQMAAIEKTMTGERYSGNIVNLSRGGAYVELASGHILPGDLLRLNIQSGSSAKQYAIDAEVVWAKTNEVNKTRSNVGLRFMKSEDVYRNLLNKY